MNSDLEASAAGGGQWVELEEYANHAGVSPRAARDRAKLGKIHAEKRVPEMGGMAKWWVHRCEIDDSVPPPAASGDRRHPVDPAGLVRHLNSLKQVVNPKESAVIDLLYIYEMVQSQAEEIAELKARLAKLEAGGSQRRPEATHKQNAAGLRRLPSVIENKEEWRDRLEAFMADSEMTLPEMAEESGVSVRSLTRARRNEGGKTTWKKIIAWLIEKEDE